MQEAHRINHFSNIRTQLYGMGRQLPVEHQQSYQPVPLACWLGLLQPNDQLLQQSLHHQLKRYPIKTGTRLRCPDRPGNHPYFGWAQSSWAFALKRVGLRLHRQQNADT